MKVSADFCLFPALKVRNATSQQTSTRAWGEVNRMEARVQRAVKDYKQAKEALERLNAGQQQFKEIKRSDLKMPGDIIEENRIGQRSDELALFWRLHGNLETDEKGNGMKECMVTLSQVQTMKLTSKIVYRVNWLRASARFQRWDEEVIHLQLEMKWTVSFFRKRKEDWQGLALENEQAGLVSYAHKQVATWERFEEQAARLFEIALKM